MTAVKIPIIITPIATPKIDTVILGAIVKGVDNKFTKLVNISLKNCKAFICHLPNTRIKKILAKLPRIIDIFAGGIFAYMP